MDYHWFSIRSLKNESSKPVQYQQKAESILKKGSELLQIFSLLIHYFLKERNIMMSRRVYNLTGKATVKKLSSRVRKNKRNRGAGRGLSFYSDAWISMMSYSDN